MAPHALLLDKTLFVALADLAQGGNANVARPPLNALREAIQARVNSAGLPERLNRVALSGLDRKTAPGDRLDQQVRLYRGGWTHPADIKFVVHVTPYGFEVSFGCWMASPEESLRFSRWIRRESMSIRDDVLAADEHLHVNHRLRVELHYTNRLDSIDPRARLWPERERDWRIWTGNEQRQATLGVWCERPLPTDLILSTVRDAGLPDPYEAAGRVLGGAAGRDLAHFDGERSLDDVLAWVTRDDDEEWLERLSAGRMTTDLLAAVDALMPIWERFQRSGRHKAPAPAAHRGWSASVDELAETVVELAGATEPTVKRVGGRAVVSADHEAKANAPRVVIERDEGVQFAFHVGRLRQTGGAARMLPVARINLRLALDGPAGDDLLALARGAGASLVFDCGSKACAPQGRCHIHSAEALVGHWLASTADPSVRWIVPSAAGQARPFDAPLQLVAGLLSQCVWDPPPLIVPEIAGLRWDVFVSTCSDSGSLSSRMADALRATGVSTWHMEDHQRPGADVRETMLGGLRACGVTLALLSPGYWASPHCIEELTTALDEGRPVVPVRVAAIAPDDADVGLTNTLAMLDVDDALAARTRAWAAGTFDQRSIYVSIAADAPLAGRTVAAIADQVRAHA